MAETLEKRREATILSVHRCRFVDYAPSAVTALGFPPLPLPSVKGKKKYLHGKQPLRYGTLAVGHANGNIDLCEWMGKENEVQSSQAWVVQKTLPGPHPSKVDSLTFVIKYPDDLRQDDVPTLKDLRLFSSGGGSELIEWDLERSCILRTINSQGGSIWCVSANPASNLLALGCEDGIIRLVSLENDTLTHLRRFDRVKCRILSIAWGPPVPRYRQARQKSLARHDNQSSDEDADEDEWTDTWLVSGGSDSSLRRWDVQTGRIIDRMATDKVRGERTLVWTVGVLGDGTIISGDSLGMVNFWDARTCTQLHSFKAHSADVLCMTISPEGKALYTSGVDQKTVQFSLVTTSNNNKNLNQQISSSSISRWAQTSSKRMHSHDVRALVSWPPYTPLPRALQRTFPLDAVPILASGGLDMNVVFAPAALPASTVVRVVNPLETSVEATFGDAYHRRMGFSRQGAVRVAREARLVVCVREAGLTVWRIKERFKNGDEGGKGGENDFEDVIMNVDEVGGSDAEQYRGGWDKVLEMDLNVSTNIIASEISDDGRWLVASDLYETKLFALRNKGNGQLAVKRVKDLTSILLPHVPVQPSPVHNSTGSFTFCFTPDSSKLVIVTALSSYVLVVDLTGEKPRVLRRFDHHRLEDTHFYDRVIKGRRDTKIVNGNMEMDEDERRESKKEESEHEESEHEEQKRHVPLSIAEVLRTAISPDGQWLATSDTHSRTHIYNLDSISHHATLPTFPRPACALSFTPGQPHVLFLAFPDNSVQIYDAEARSFPAWGRVLCTSLPKRFTNAHDPVLGLTFEPSVVSRDRQKLEWDFNKIGPERYALFWGPTWLFKIALDTTLRVGGRKRRRGQIGEGAQFGANGMVRPGGQEERQWRDFKMVTHYRPILCVDFLDKGELVIVERPLVDVLSTMSPAFFKHKYGAS